MYFLDQSEYGDNPLAHDIMQKRTGEGKKYVCSKCHDAILGSSLVPCPVCAQEVAKKIVLFLTQEDILHRGHIMLNIVILWACQHNMFVEIVTVQNKSNIYVSAVRR